MPRNDKPAAAPAANDAAHLAAEEHMDLLAGCKIYVTRWFAGYKSRLATNMQILFEPEEFWSFVRAQAARSRDYGKPFQRMPDPAETKSRFLTWVMTIARNKFVSLLRESNRQPPVQELPHSTSNNALEQVPGRGKTASSNLRHEESAEEVQAAVAALPETQRAVMELVLLGLETKEVAELLDLPRSVVTMRRQRAKAALEVKLGPLLRELFGDRRFP